MDVLLKYVRERLNDIVEVIETVRQWSENDVKPIRIDLFGLERAIRALPKEAKKSLEGFFDLTSKKPISPFRRYLFKGTKEFIWNRCTPSSVMEKGNKALDSLLLMQQWRFVLEYDSEVRDGAKKLQEKTDLPGEEGISFLLLYCMLMVGGKSFFFDSIEKGIEVKKEEIESFDSISLIVLACEVFKDRKLKISIFKEFFEVFVPDTLKKELLEAVGMKIPKELTYIQGTPGTMTFQRLRRIKESLFPKGPWEATEALIENRCRKAPGIATLRKKDTYEWRHSYVSDAYELVGEKTLPNGETIPLYRVRGVKSSINFSDLGEVVFLDHLYERGMI